MIRIEPFDPVFFRDGKPFTMGEDSWGNGMFPPMPSVVYGALRASWFANNISHYAKAGKADDPTLGLKIKGLFVEYQGSMLVPLPMDCVAETRKENKATLLKLHPAPSLSNCATPMILKPGVGAQIVDSVQGGWVDDISLSEYLNGKRTTLHFISQHQFTSIEPRTGITLDRGTRTAKAGNMYRIGMNRMLDAAFVVNYTDLDIPRSGMLKLGGEGKGAAYQPVNFDLPSAPKLEDNMLKLYLLTPAIFSNGWLPGWINPSSLEGEYVQGNVKLRCRVVAAVIGDYLSVGGWDIQKNAPKPMRKAVPAGSVYYLQLLEGDLVEVSRGFHGLAISDQAQDQKEGFGICYVGKVRI